MNSPKSNTRNLIPVAILMAGGVLIFDLLLPLGVASGIPYVAVVLVTLWMTKPGYTLAAGITASIFVFIGFQFSPAGGIMWMVVTNRFLALFGIWAAVLFILKYKQTDNVARQDQESAQLYLDMAGTMFIVVDRNEKVSLINQKGLNLLGYKEKEVIGKNWFENFLPENSRDSAKDVFDQLINGDIELMNSYENPVLTKSGEERLIAWHNTVIKDDEGNITGTLSSGEDITDRKNAEDKVIRVEEHLRSLHEITSNENVSSEQKIVSLLQLGCRSFGLPIGILASIKDEKYSVVEIISPESLIKRGDTFKFSETFCKEAIQNPEPLHIEYVAKSHWHAHPCYQKTKLEVYIGMRVMVEGEVYGTINFSSPEPRETTFTSTDMDIVMLMAEWVGGEIQRQQMQDKLHTLNVGLEEKVIKRTEELEQALREIQNVNFSIQEESDKRKLAEEKAKSALVKEKELGELKSRFVSMASHEFRTPLSGVLTSASLIERYNEPEQKDKRGKHIRTIKEAVRNLTGILNDFLSIEKLETGKIECNPAPFDIDEFARETMSKIEHMLKQGQQIKYKNNLDIHEVYLDQSLLKPVLNNLLTNALKYSPEGKTIDLLISSDDTEIAIEVQDTGIGIPEKDKKHMFERFYRAENATNISGTGLGLNIAKKQVELMDGTITFKSEQEVGTTFIVKLPKIKKG